MSKEDLIYKFWQKNSKQNTKSGSKDLIADKLEQKAIINEIKKIKIKDKILEIGCGDGRSTLNIASQLNSSYIDAFDYSSEMILLANKRKNKNIKKYKSVNFFIENILNMEKIKTKYDIIISKRCLINLTTYKKQLQAIYSINKLLKKNGSFLMCENSTDGLKKINHLRKKLKLNQIIVPWHNLYFNENKLEKDIKNLELINKLHFNSTYYFLSRIVNAYISKLEHKDIDYNSHINRLALDLPMNLIDNFSQGVIWVWRKNSK